MQTPVIKLITQLRMPSVVFVKLANSAQSEMGPCGFGDHALAAPVGDVHMTGKKRVHMYV